jgi:hypothetical protein
VTYEPGQKVLVRGIVRWRARKTEAYWVFFGNQINGRYTHGYVPAADIVGPAPATPDEGDEDLPPLTSLIGSMPGLRAELAKERDAALAAAEAERDAYAAALAKLAHEYTADEYSQPCTRWMHDWGEDCASDPDHPIHQTPAVIRRALSVEAAGAEGGGGHE